MTEFRMMSLSRLRERAEQCHRLASLALSDGIATELEKLACDYDSDAARIESLGYGCAVSPNEIIVT